MAFAKIILISLIGFLVGAAILFGFISGPLAVIASPILAIFGWFYLFPIALCVALLWTAYHPGRGVVFTWAFVAFAGVGGALLMTIIGVRGAEPFWLRGYAIGGFVAGGDSR